MKKILSSMLMSLMMTIPTTLLADDKDTITDFIKNAVSHDERFNFKNVEIKSSKDIKELIGWKVYFININLTLKDPKQNGKEVTISDSIFTNGDFIAPDLINTKTKQKLKDTLLPKLSDSFYDKEHLIYGSIDAPHKVVIFSDPVCPFCIDFVPSMIKEIKDSKTKQIALFYYHYPLTSIHPKAPTIVKAVIAAELKGVKDVAQRVYEVDFDSVENVDKEIVELFNKELKTSITVDDINSKEVMQRYNQDISKANESMARGTPTIFFDGEKDSNRVMYKNYLK